MSTLFPKPEAAETKRQFKIKSRFNLFVFVVSVTLTIAAPLRGEQPSGKTLSSVDLIFDNHTAVGYNYDVPCPPGIGGKCVCAVNNYGSTKPERFSFHMESISSGSPQLTSGVVHLMCGSLSGAVLPPTLGMIQAAFPKVVLLKATYSDGSDATKDELSGSVSEAHSTTQKNATSGHSTNAPEASNVHAKERVFIVRALQDSNGDLAQAAKKLGISDRALARKMKEYKIEATYR